LTVADVTFRDEDTGSGGIDQKVWRALVIDDPFVNGADNVWPARVHRGAARLESHLSLMDGQTFLKRLPAEQTVHIS
jgi:hypothetical protein